MPTVPSANGRFFVVTACVTQVQAAATATAAGGTLAALTTATVGQVQFPIDAFSNAPQCTMPHFGTVAWFGTYNGGAPERSVYAIELTTGQIYNIASHQAASWTALVLAESPSGTAGS
ncbi:hypothetical protein [Nocardia sp. NPDC051570]|uniref:hypothetical protein n=1 Tax=Nocardia sp. NPDC051570 TaxID=3364324 RepID=UPI00379A00ED